MAYHVGNGIWSGVFAVPTAITDVHLKLASGLAVKVLLLALRRNGLVEPAEMAAALGQSVADIQDALNYWLALGILSTGEPEPVAQPAPTAEKPVVLQMQPAAVATEEPVPDQGLQRIQTLTSRRPRLTTQEINELADQDKNITYLLQESQNVLGKPLTAIASSTMASLYSYTGMQPDLILMLVHYCVSIGKDSMGYIEKLADDWAERGIDSHEKAEAEILRLTKKNRAEGKIKSAFGIYDRHLVPREREYIRTWTEEYKLELPLIKLAFERSVETKGKLSFAYINGILTNWHAAGIATPAQALEEIKAGRNKAVPAKGEKPADKRSSYDLGELEKMIDGGGV